MSAVMLGSAARRALLAVALLAAAGYPLAPWHDAGARIVLKALAVLALAGVAALRRDAPGSPLLAATLVAHSIGDVLLEIGPFLAGMAAFGAGHLGYAGLFAGARRPWEQVDAGAKARLGLLALAGALLLARLAPRLEGALEIAVPLYALLLLAMAAFAQVARRGAPWLALGALLFVLSDALLALDLFAGPLPGARWAVWPAYWSAQATITLAWLGRAR